MAKIKRWHGDGLSTGTLTTSSAGTGDDAFSSFIGSSTRTIDASGTRSPRIKVTQVSGQAAAMRWTYTAQTKISGRLRFKTPATWPTTSYSIVRLTNVSTEVFRVDVVGQADPGKVRLRNGTTLLASSAANALSVNTDYTLEFAVDHTAGTAVAQVYAGDDNSTLLANLSASSSYGTASTICDVGQTLTTPDVGDVYYDDIDIDDSGVLLGPASTSYSGSSTMVSGSSLSGSVAALDQAAATMVSGSSLMAVLDARASMVSGSSLTGSASATLRPAATMTSGSSLAGAATVATPALVRVMLGIPDPTAIRANALTTGTGSVRLAVSTSSGMSSPVFSAPVVPDAQGYAPLLVSGLTADTAYWYQIELNGTLAGAPVRVKTLPTPGTAASFSLAFGSCVNVLGLGPATANPAVFAAIKNRPSVTGQAGPEEFWHLGDVSYPNSSTTGPGPYIPDDPAVIRSNYEAGFSAPTLAALAAAVPTGTILSDNDSGGSNCDAGSGAWPALSNGTAVTVRKQVTSGPTYPDPAALYWSHQRGRVLLIALDERSYSSGATVADNSSKTKLGTAQRAWLLALLSGARAAGVAQVIILSDTLWVNGVGTSPSSAAGTPAQNDGWGAYSTERTQVGVAIAACGVSVLYCNGDTHSFGADDGAHNSHGGFPYFTAAPFSNTANAWSSGTTTHVAYPGSNLSNQQYYGWLDVVDNGSTLTVTATAYDSSASAGDYTADVVRGTPMVLTVSEITGTATMQSGSSLAGSAARTQAAGVTMLSGSSLVGDQTRVQAAAATMLSGSALTGAAAGNFASMVSGSLLAGAAASKLNAAAVMLSASSLSGFAIGPTLTADPDPGNAPPRVVLSVLGVSTAATTITINRVDQAGNKSPVRTGNPASLVAGGWVGFDYEAPFGQPVTYVGTTDIGGVVTSDPVTLAVQEPWLSHPGIPDLSQPLRIANIGDRTRPSKRGLHDIMARDTQLPITDGVRGAPSFVMQVKTYGQDDAAGLIALLADESTLLLRIAYPPSRTRTDYYWVSVGDVAEGDLVQGYPDDPYTLWTLPCTVVDAPAGLLQSQRTWADVIAEFPTWQDVSDTYATWRDVILDNRIGS